MERRALGQKGEKLAQDYLKSKGYRILEANYRCSIGEIDIIAENKNRFAFVEVRTRSSREYGTPEESITEVKKEKLASLCMEYINNHKVSREWHLDLVAVEVNAEGKLKRIDHIPDVLA